MRRVNDGATILSQNGACPSVEIFYFIFFLTVLIASEVFGAVFHVDGDNPASGNGSTWGNAYKTVQEAIGSAQAGDEIWVKSGTYLTGVDRNYAFNLKADVAIYGGFDGTETLRSERDWRNNVTVLSGDISGDDSGFLNNTENSYHVVMGFNADGAVIDGFTITGGNADDTGINASGAGIYSNSTLTIANCTFQWNNAAFRGAGLFNYGTSNSTITESVFRTIEPQCMGGRSSSPSMLHPKFPIVSLTITLLGRTAVLSMSTQSFPVAQIAHPP